MMRNPKVYKINVLKDPITFFLFNRWKNYFLMFLFFFSAQILISFFSGTLTEIDINFLSYQKRTRLGEEFILLPTIKDLGFIFYYLLCIVLFFPIIRFFLNIPKAFENIYINEIFKKKKGSKRKKILTDYNESLKGFENLLNAKYMYLPAFFFLFWYILLLSYP